MEFHISRAVREAAKVDDLLFSYTGNVVFADVAASRRLAIALNESRPNADPASAFNAGALFAMGLIDELSHALVASYRKQLDPNVLSEAVRWFASQFEPAKLDQLLLAFTEQFPNVAVFRNQLTAAQWLRGTTDGLPNREAALEELLLLWIANTNPAFKPFRALFEDASLKQQTAYANITAAFPTFFSTRPPMPAIGTLLDALRAPFLASPDSLTGQLDFIRERWAPFIGADLRRILLAIDVLREEDLAIWMRFNPPGPDQYRHGAPTWGSQGFEGDEYVGFRGLRRYGHGYQAPLDEYEAFSTDQAWMPNVVLIAKSTYVWLEQLSKKYRRHIFRLDQIPDEELHLLAHRGITGLWLIGLWERSTASQTIKRLRGHFDAVASAYSLKSYDIAEDLGGWQAYDHLKRHAAAAGLRLASDMVPNHMGIDSPWIIEHPDWFLHRWESPFPSYRFDGPDLSSDSRVEIKIEDHYYDQSDAAVAFRLRHHSSGETRYVYHGNDGTTFAWNDTAQLDYSSAEVREHVIQTILHVARLFPIIRFDAAMVLAKRHVQRLWFPLPGAGGSIPSRAENSMSQEEFDRLMPNEFWREVVDRVAAEVPGTLLLAEAFWLLEGYFVRTLGMHRVYNSAFMNMLRDEENAKYRSYLKKTIEFDPDIMKRYVNFMSNPDERTAIDQFGTGDKYFGVSTLLATLPGLPMFGHGQIEGYTERYGMEFKQAKMDEWPDEHLVARHQREIAPLLMQRRIFAGSADFTLYDFWNHFGAVDENVFAYSNRTDGERSLVVYNNKYDSTAGTIHVSAAYMDKGSGQMRQRSLAEGLALSTDHNVFLALRDNHGLEYLRRASDLHHHGMHFDLHGFQSVVLLGWHERRPSAEWPWDRLHDSLAGAGVPNLDDALSMLRLRPLHDALREAISPHNLHLLTQAATKPGPTKPGAPFIGAQREKPGAPSIAAFGDGWDEQSPKLQSIAASAKPFLDQWLAYIPAGSLTPNPPEPTTTKPPTRTPKPSPTPTYAESLQPALSAAAQLPTLIQSLSAAIPAQALSIFPTSSPESADNLWSPILASLLLRALPSQRDPIALFDQLRLRTALANIFANFGLEGEATWQAAARVRLLLSPIAVAPNAIRTRDLWTDPDVRWLAGVNHSSGATWFNRERFEELLAWLQLPTLLDIANQSSAKQPSALAELDAAATAASQAAQSAGYNLDAYLASAPTTPERPTATRSPSKPGAPQRTRTRRPKALTS
ncbi:MAG: alpha-amylase family glycosyl hydrolase [Acidobacteriaceae bacterium]|jgi:glycosidase